MDRREFLKVSGSSLVGLFLGGCGAAMRGAKKVSKLPNIVVVFTDDQGYADLGCFGARGFETPNVDRMAAEGVLFTDFHVSQAVCSASRAGLMTGCYSNRVSIRGALMPWSQNGLNPDEMTIAEMLKQKGYATGVFGKWHLGHHREFLPLQRGFDEYLGLPYSNDMWPVTYTGEPLKEGRKSRYPELALIDGNEKAGEIRTLTDQDKLTTMYTERAVGFIEKNKHQPFFLYVPHSMPHVPLGVSDKFRGKSEQGIYGDVIMEIDWSVGQILDTLKECGLDDNTLVIFASDNGPWLNFGKHAGSAGPLREGKGTMWEGGDRVPCVMRWPAVINRGRVCEKIVSTIDFLPTFAAITGAALPKKKIDGVNILPLLKGERGAEPRDHFFYYYGRELRAVRQGKWKLHFPHEYRSYENVEPRNDGNGGPYGKGRTGLELYDLESDVGERKDLAAEHPEIVKRLSAMAEKMREELGDSLTGREGSEVRPAGEHVE